MNLVWEGRRGYGSYRFTLHQAAALDPIYNIAARYNLAYAYIRRNDKGDLNHAIENLTAVYKQLQEDILPQFQLQLIMLGISYSNTALEQQISTKMNFKHG